ncbi:MAG: RNase P subunit p30 family protein [Nanoarchaeota archaeon]
MNFYDMHVSAEDVKKTIEIAEKLGWSGLVFIRKWNGEKKPANFANEAKKLDCSMGLIVDAKKANDMQKTVKSTRKQTELIIVKAGDLEFNRVVLETPEVDILSGFNIQLNHVMCELAKKNNVAIEFNFHDLISSYKNTREKIFNNMIENAKFIRKYKTPFVITSGAMDPWDMRSPQDLLSFGRLLGFQDPQIKKAMSSSVLTENRKRLSDKWIAPGVELE